MTEWLTNFVNNYLTDFVVRLLFALVILVVGFALVNAIDKKISKNEKLRKKDETASSFLTNFVGGALKVLIVITAFRRLPLSLSSAHAALLSVSDFRADFQT